MAKNLFGGAIINSGPDLPSAADALDGSLFLKTGVGAGLYFYGFTPDTNIAIGQQSSRDWTLIAASGGVDLSDYVQKAGDTVTGMLTFTNSASNMMRLESNDPAIAFYELDQPLNAKGWLVSTDNQEMQFQTLNDNGTLIGQVFSISRSGVMKINGSPVSFGGAPNVSTATGVLPVANGGTGQSSALAQGGIIYAATGSEMASTATGPAGAILFSNGTASPTWTFSAPGVSVGSANTATNANFAVSAGTATTATTANNANLLQGFPPDFGAVGDTVAMRTNLGYIFGNYFNSGAPANETDVVSQIIYNNGSDGFLRKGSVAHVLNTLVATSAIHTAARRFISNQDTSFSGASSNLQVEAASTGVGATISFHRPTLGALNMGLDSDNIFRIGGWSSTAGLFTMNLSGDVGILGNFTAAGNVTAFSDRRLKTDIGPIENPIEKVRQLNGVNYTRKGTDTRGTGLIAQDVQKVAPEAVVQNEEGYLSVAYGNLVGLLVEAIKMQQDQIDELSRTVDHMMGVTRKS